MSEDTVVKVLAHQLNGMADTQMETVFANLSCKAFSTVFPLICGRASEEVRKSISVDLMSSLSTNQKIDLLVDSDEEEIPVIVEGLKETSTSSFSSYERVNELDFGRFVRPQLDS